MFPGGGGMDDRKMQQMMKQMGIDMQELDAEEVIIRTANEELVFSKPDVQRMDAQGQQTYTIVGEPESRDRGEDGSGEPAIEEGEGDSGAAAIPDDDVELVATRAGVGENEAREALEATDGDLAAAIERIE
ncbi:nascent polypeptide-associated complex protein [Halobacteriales archaeon QS_9_67_15]|nr:MAG: nascent polypeptide-associated complex protein [Halobacteriales archaeon QS_9_67_15]